MSRIAAAAVMQRPEESLKPKVLCCCDPWGRHGGGSELAVRGHYNSGTI